MEGRGSWQLHAEPCHAQKEQPHLHHPVGHEDSRLAMSANSLTWIHGSTVQCDKLISQCGRQAGKTILLRAEASDKLKTNARLLGADTKCMPPQVVKPPAVIERHCNLHARRHSMTYMHDEGFGLDFGQKGDIGKDICPSRPPVHVGIQAAHACTQTRTA